MEEAAQEINGAVQRSVQGPGASQCGGTGQPGQVESPTRINIVPFPQHATWISKLLIRPITIRTSKNASKGKGRNCWGLGTGDLWVGHGVMVMAEAWAIVWGRSGVGLRTTWDFPTERVLSQTLFKF